MHYKKSNRMLYLLIIIEIILLYIAIKFTHKDYLSPCVVTLALFFVSTVSVVPNIEYWDVDFRIVTVLYLSIFFLTIVMTEIIVKGIMFKKNRWIDLRTCNKANPIQVNSLLYIIICIVIILATLVYVRAIFRIGGATLLAIGFVKEEELPIGLIPKMCVRMAPCYSYPFIFIMIYNMVYCKDRIKYNIKYLIPIVCYIVVIFFSGVRSPLVYPIAAALVYVIMMERFRFGWDKINLLKYMWSFMVIFGVFIVFFFSIRGVVKNKEYDSDYGIMSYITYYWGSPIHLFNKVIDNTSLVFPTNYHVFGANTFVGLYEEQHTWGLSKVDIRTNETEFQYVGGDFEGGGNVYTMFISPLHDFGFYGTLLYLICFYGLISLFYYKKIKYSKYKKRAIIPIYIYGYFFYFILMTFYSTTTCFLKFQMLIPFFTSIIMLKFMMWSGGIRKHSSVK